MIKLLIATLLVFQSSIYSLSVTSLSGEQISLSSFKGKKLLLVNIATQSKRAGQLQELEELQQQFKDRLVVIGFPSNSFSHEARSNAEIQAFCENTYHISFLVAQKAGVAGSELQPVYGWLTNQSENGVLQGAIKGDFQKYLVDEKGNLIGVFAPNVSPLDSALTTAISASY